MQVKLWPIGRVKPYPNNPRVNDAAVDAVAASIRDFGWRQPIVVDSKGVIIVGALEGCPQTWSDGSPSACCQRSDA